MARGRMISKSLSTSEKFAALTILAGDLVEFCHALYPLLVVHTDDFGRLQGDVYTVKLQCYPASSRTLEEFAAALESLQRVELIAWYAVAGKKYVQVQNFEPHQMGLHKRTKSQFPEIPGKSRKVPEIPGQEKGRELKRREEKRTKDLAPPKPAPTQADLQQVFLTNQKKTAELLANHAKVKGTTVAIKQGVHDFIVWFKAEYKTDRHGADYLVKEGKDHRLVKTMLTATTFERLQNLARILLSDKLEDDYVTEKMDRGIGTLSNQFNKLNDRLAQWELRQKAGNA